MITLSIETTEKFGSVALLDGKHVLAEINLPKDRRSSQTLHPAMQSLFEQSGTKPQDVSAVAVVTGPGSFTGLRVGVTAAKVFAYTTGAKVVALDTFQTVASALRHSGFISIGVDAQRGEVVSVVFRRMNNGKLETIQKPKLMPISEWWHCAKQYADQCADVVFSGPALERWQDKVPSHIVLAEASDWFPKASVAGQLAADRIAAEQFDDVWTLLPLYSRLSAAEEKKNS